MCHCLSSLLKEEACFGFREICGELDVRDCSDCAVTSVNPKFSTSAGVKPALWPVWCVTVDLLTVSPVPGSFGGVGDGDRGQYGCSWFLRQSSTFVFSRLVNLLPH